MRSLAVAALVATVAGLPTGGAHTRSDLDAWREAWAEAQADALTIEGLTTYLDMLDRHPWYLDLPVQLSVYRGVGNGNVERWRPLVAAWFPPDQVDRALCIMKYESGGNPDAKNQVSSARGLFQILASLWAPHYGIPYDALYNPQLNVRLAADIWSHQGWTAWTVWNRGLCP